MPLTSDQSYDAARRLADDMFVARNAVARFDLDTLKANVDALTSFVEANAATINSQFVEPFKSNATVAEKRALLAYACMKLAGFV